jgi:trans-2,3-dihydro-3-hydroxyanthranilate isomerase
MPFAGHPNVGTGFVLATLGKARGNVLVLEQPAGPVRISVGRDVRSEPSLVTIAAPQPLSVGAEVDPAMIASAIGLEIADIITTAHRPVIASVGIGFVIAEVNLASLSKAKADQRLFQSAAETCPELGGRLFVHIYARDRGRLRARMFAPLAGMPEDPATGSANAALGALLLSLGTQETGSYRVLQGVEMGRPSLMQVTASHVADGFRAKVGGGCKMVLRGEVMIEDVVRVPGDGNHWGPL